MKINCNQKKMVSIQLHFKEKAQQHLRRASQLTNGDPDTEQMTKQ